MLGIGYQLKLGKLTLELVEIEDFKLKFRDAKDKEAI